MTSVNLNQMDLVVLVLKEIDRQFPDICPLPRQYNAIIDGVNGIVREFSIGEKKAGEGIGVEAWRRTDQVGRSSDFMATKLSRKGMRDYAHPHDPSDFGRCISLLDAAPELRLNLNWMAREGKQWAILVQHWEELEALYREESKTGRCPQLYDKMQKLYADCE